MERKSDHSIVVSVVDYGESDRLVTLLTRLHGKVSAFAAAARKSKRRFGGALEPGTLLLGHWQERKSDLAFLEAVDVQNGFHRMRADLSLIARSAYALELCREMVREREPNASIFDALVGYLAALDAQQAGPTSLLAFELQVLSHVGLTPVFGCCALCGKSGAGACVFDPAHGGAVCQACENRLSGGWRTSWEHMKMLNGLLEGQREKMEASWRLKSRELLNYFVEHHIGRRLKSAAFMEQLGLD